MDGMKPDVECEIKLKVATIDAGLDLLRNLRAVLEEAPRFEDNECFDTPDRRLGAVGQLLRLRVVDGRGRLTFKEPVATDKRAKVRAETETAVENPDAIRAILIKCGFERVYRYQKYRSYHRWRDPDSGGALAICLDETPIGVFMELEGDMAAIDRAATLMGFARKDYILEDYRSLHHAWLAEHGGGPSEMVFEDRAEEGSFPE